MTFELLRSHPDTTANTTSLRNNAVCIMQTIGSSVSCLGVLAAIASPGIAQIVPDNTAGTVVTPNRLVDGLPATLIEGGTSQGANLFQSFTDFNVDTGQRVYFANPATVENILSRVTGGAISNIDGLLGVNGDANLFLLNPNGVIFGPNTRLDINGSFTTSTAGSFVFADGSEFRALPQVGELFSASVPLGVQFNSNNPPQGDISSTGNLELKGQDISFLGQNITLRSIDTSGTDGETTNIDNNSTVKNLAVVAGNGGAITLIAADNLKTDDLTSTGGRGGNINLDTSNGPVTTTGNLTSTGGNGGNINLQANGNLTAETIDASGGEGGLFIQQGMGALNLMPGKPLASNGGNGGSINLQANSSTNITGGVFSDAGSLDFIPEGIGRVLTASFNVGNGGNTTIRSTDNISVGSIEDLNDNEVVLSSEASLQTFNLPDGNGDIRGGDIGNAGNISIISISGNISILGNISSPSSSEALSSAEGSGSVGNGGNINISSISGDITLAELDSSSVSLVDSGNVGTTGNGGRIQISSGSGNIRLTSADSSSFATSASDDVNASNSGNGGDIKLSSNSGIIEIRVDPDNNELDSSSFSLVGNTGNAGNILISAPSIRGINNSAGSGEIEIEVLATSIVQNRQSDRAAGQGGTVTLSTRGTLSGIEVLTISSAGRSGDVIIQGTNDLILQNLRFTTSGQIEIEDRRLDNRGEQRPPIVLDASAFGASGNTAIASAGDLTLDNVQIFSDAQGRNNGGNITIEDAGIVILKNNTSLQTNTGSEGTAGNIFVRDVDALVFRNNSFLLSNANGQANGGNVSIDTPFVVSALDENNDILVTAVNGRGGTVNIQVTSLLGFGQSTESDFNVLRQLPSNDISASSQSGADGVVALDVLELDPSEGLTELPADLTDRSNQITAGCGIGNNNDTQSEFVITGRGGLPPSPNDSANANQVNIPWVTYTEDTQTTIATTTETSPSESLIEAQQIAMDAAGNAYFVPHGNQRSEDTLIASGLPLTEQCAATVLSQH